MANLKNNDMEMDFLDGLDLLDEIDVNSYDPKDFDLDEDIDLDDINFDEEDDFDNIIGDDEEVEEEEEEEIVEEVKPKTTTKKKTTTAKKETTKKEVKKEEKPEAKKKTTTKKTTKTVKDDEEGFTLFIPNVSDDVNSYDELLERIRRTKVEPYNEIKARVEAGDRSKLPTNKKIGRNDLSRLIRFKMQESDTMKTVFDSTLRKLKIKVRPEDKQATYNLLQLNLTQTEKLVQELIIDVVYDLLKIESGLDLIDKDDCKFSFYGELQNERVVDNSKLTAAGIKNNATLIGEHIKVISSSRSPEAVKTRGNLVKGKFVPLKEEK